MFNKKNILKHYPIDLSFPTISSAKNNIPEWYKKQDKFANGVKKPKSFPIPLTFKSCFAFGDSFTTGYTIPLPVDIAIEQKENGPYITWNSPINNNFIELRESNLNKELPIPHGYSSNHYVWCTKNAIDIPKGYSLLITHPLNRYDLPFLTLSGIVDGEYILPPGNIPVFFSNTFEGIISAGTPIAQIIPIKQESWTLKQDSSILEKANINNLKSLNTAFGWYKKNIWKRKAYE